MDRYEALNDRQLEAVRHTEGPLLILAGAGSGKTRVLTHRTAYLIGEKGVKPYHILAITFTNKAAGEMRERIDSLVEYGSESVWVSTFHSACARILRRNIDRIGFDNHFAIYDADDQKTVIKDVFRQLELNTKIYKERAFLDVISSAKDELVSPEEFARTAAGNTERELQARVYLRYQETLRRNNALDFDDLIVKCVELLQTVPEVLETYQERFRYIMVDEYQDTNTAQFHLIRLLAGKYRNLCVVGDDDQSIYRFRGANINNILHFEIYFPDAKVVRLEENYRSTQNILDAANCVIRNNAGRKEKTLWTRRGAGDAINFQEFDTAYDEAGFIVRDIRDTVERDGCRCGDCAVLYRTNAQSRVLEEKFVYAGVPYQIVGGVNFYARKEIKDLLAYLKTVDNALDDLAVKRIINVPKRGIGDTTIQKVQLYANEQGISFYDALSRAEDIPSLRRAAVTKLRSFETYIRALRSKLPYLSIRGLLEQILEDTGYVEELKVEGTDEAKSRIENIDELISKIVTFEEQAETPVLGAFLEEVALVADIDSLEGESDRVVLMTLHSAKGLEFPNVYLSGMEDGLFPGYMAITADNPEELEEERRLCYVGITRAMNHLTLTCAHMRMIRGETQYHRISRFVKEIPVRLLKGDVWNLRRSAGSSGKSFASAGGSSGRREGGLSERPVWTAGDSRRETDGGSRERSGGAAGISGRETGGGFSERSGGTAGVSAMGTNRSGSFSKRSAGEAGDSSWSGTFTPGREWKAEARDFGDAGNRISLDYEVGDRVRHGKFGEGTVLQIVSGGRDFEVAVNFDKFGVKKMFASFAKLRKL